jgi:hypothetical protein
MGIPTHAVPLPFSGCSKWHGSNAIPTQLPYNYLLDLLKIKSKNI